MKKKWFNGEGYLFPLLKWLRIMKLTAFILLVSLVHLSASVYSQQTKLDVSLQNASVRDVLKSIEDQSEYFFLYTNEDIDVNRKVSVDFKEVSVEQILNQVFQGTDVSYRIADRQIVLIKNNLAVNSFQSQQQKTVTGKVTESNGQPLPGVTVVVKGTTMGTITDTNGNYSLTKVPGNISLVFSFVGMKTQEVPVSNKTNIDVVMSEENIGIEEVVAVGYGTIKKSDLTGSVSSLKSEEIQTGAQSSVDQFMQGRIPGVYVTQSSSDPGGGYSIRIRGTNSITAGNEPLYVIDGLPSDPENSINPGDVESIEVLKDASATAIYGARGANGVILITTKRGRKGKTEINYNGYVGIQKAAKTLNMLNGEEYMTLLNALNADKGEDPLFSPSEIDAIGSGTDWQEKILETAMIQNHNLSLSGGDENTRYYASLSYLDQDGIVINTGLERYNARVNLTHTTDRLNVEINMNTSLVNKVTGPNDQDINLTAGVMGSALQMDPTIGVKDKEGNYTQSSVLDLNNPVALAYSKDTEHSTDRTFGNVSAEYELFNGFKAKLNFGSDRSIRRTDFYLDKTTKIGQSSNGKATVNEYKNTSYLLELTASYEKELSNMQRVSAVAGYSYQEFGYNAFGTTSSDFSTDAFGTYNLEAGDPNNTTNWSERTKNQLLSWLARVNYSYKDKYLATASFRADGSSRFGKNNKYGYFPSFALAWKMSNEPFLSNVEALSQLKLRGSYGLTGNQEIGNYASLVLLGTGGDAIFNDQPVVSIVPTQLANPDLKWETTKQINLGVDYGFLNNRITGSIEWFSKKTYDLLLELPIPRTSGFSTSLQNVGDTKNSGFEFVIQSKNFVHKFKWSTTFNIATVKNEVVNLGNLPYILQGNMRWITDFTILTKGESMNSYYGYEVEGIFQSQSEVASSAQLNAAPGDIKYRDVSGDGAINSDDRTILGDPFPDFTFGFLNDLSFKGFDISIFIDGSYGNDMLNFTRIESENPIEFRRNRESYVLDRWTENNKTSKNPSFLNPDATRAINSRVIEDASYLRLKYIRLSYNFPHFSWKGISSLSLYTTAQNLFTITNYSGFNPDVNVMGTSNQRYDYNSHPVARMYSVGINVKF